MNSNDTLHQPATEARQRAYEGLSLRRTGELRTLVNHTSTKYNARLKESLWTCPC